MNTGRIPTVGPTTGRLFLLLNVIALAFALYGAYTWTLYFLTAAQVLYWFTVLHEHMHHTYPHEEHP